MGEKPQDSKQAWWRFGYVWLVIAGATYAADTHTCQLIDTKDRQNRRL